MRTSAGLKIGACSNGVTLTHKMRIVPMRCTAQNILETITPTKLVTRSTVTLAQSTLTLIAPLAALLFLKAQNAIVLLRVAQNGLEMAS